jgi:SAM-dependent methyltransferase
VSGAPEAKGGAAGAAAGGVALPYVDPALYDVVYSWYDLDREFYLATARAARGPVLEVACGTGRLLLPSRAAGIDIDGIDLEPAMIAHLEAKAAAAGIAVNVQVADMRDFALARRYRLVTIPFRAFMHLRTTGDQLRALRRIRDHLEPGGALVMNQFYPSVAIMAAREGRWICEREFVDASTGARCERKVERSDAAEVAHYGFTLRWTYRYEMELLFRRAGFDHWDVRGGFDGRPFERDTDEMVWTAVRD